MLPPGLTNDLKNLEYRSASVQAVMNSSDATNRFTAAFQALDKLANQENLPIAIVGGLAAIRYGYPAVTEDIDIAIGRNDLERFLVTAPRYGFRVVWRAESGWHTLEFGDVEINVVPEGGKASNDAPTEIPSPEKLGVSVGVGYAGLPQWIELKISSGRRKDLTHVVEVLKQTSPDVLDQIRTHLESVHTEYSSRFNDLANEAEEERKQEDERR